MFLTRLIFICLFFNCLHAFAKLGGSNPLFLLFFTSLALNSVVKWNIIYHSIYLDIMSTATSYITLQLCACWECLWFVKMRSSSSKLWSIKDFFCLDFMCSKAARKVFSLIKISSFYKSCGQRTKQNVSNRFQVL